MNKTVKQYIESALDDITEIDFLVDKELSYRILKFTLEENIVTLFSLKSEVHNFNGILQHQIDFFEDCLTELEKVLIK